ncbi:MAG: hypothetical protein HOO67_05225 [Candidatus Peribacteraceae bacterium]|nr:hypothetical protein [Candidatus Peribacteraceae bacterium]
MRRFLPMLLTAPLLLSACGGKLTGSVTPDDMDQPQGTQEQPVPVQEQPEQPVPIAAPAVEHPLLPNFTVMGTYVTVDGEQTMIFEYPNESTAAADRAKVSADGQSIGGDPVNWGGPVHFFHAGRVIVAYPGSNESIVAKLRTDAGAQFAGN